MHGLVPRILLSLVPYCAMAGGIEHASATGLTQDGACIEAFARVRIPHPMKMTNHVEVTEKKCECTERDVEPHLESFRWSCLVMVKWEEVPN